MNNLTTKIRQFLSAISEQAFYYLAAIAGIFAWGYFNSVYAAVVVFVAGIVLAWFISSKIEGKNHSNQ